MFLNNNNRILTFEASAQATRLACQVITVIGEPVPGNNTISFCTNQAVAALSALWSTNLPE